MKTFTKNSKFISITILTLTIALLFNNCQKAVFSSQGDNKLAGTEIILDTILKCQEAEDAGVLKSTTQKIIFEDTAVESKRPGNICEFEKDDNLSMAEGELRARYTQTQSVALPADAVLCDVKMQSAEQNFRYDDVFFISFNGHLLASNDKTAVELKLAEQWLYLPISKGDIKFYDYDWLKVRTAPFQNQNIDDYCIGAVDGISSCQWPLTEKFGKIQLNFSQEVLVAMSAGQKAQTLQFVITGDNNPDIDCYHQKLVLDADVKYFIPQK